MESGGSAPQALKTEISGQVVPGVTVQRTMTATPSPTPRAVMAPTTSKAIQPRIPAQDLLGDKLLRDLPRTAFNDSKVPSIAGIALIAKLGQGGMGAVYYGLNLRLNKDVAVKVLSIDSGNSATVQRFYREAQIAANISSPHLVSVYDINEAEGLFYLVMEFVSGQTAGAWLEQERGAGRGGLPEADALDVCIAATEGLSAAHAENIIHRDIKPDNILIPYTRGQRVLRPCDAKVADLGLARSTEGDVALTMNDASMGTPGFMAPEQAMDARTAGKAADVFSLGATLFTLLCGEPPFTGQTAMNIILATIQSPHSSARRLRPNLSTDAERIIERCLVKDPNQRFGDAQELLDALKDCRASRRASRTVMLSAVPSILPSSANLPATAPVAPPVPGIRPAVKIVAVPVPPKVAVPAVLAVPTPLPTPKAPVTLIEAQQTMSVPAPAPIPNLAPLPEGVVDDLEDILLPVGPDEAERQKKLDRIVAHIAGRSDGAMLAVSQFMSEVQGALRNNSTSGTKIAALITKDVALTKTLLQTVNTAYYSGGNSQGVASIMHAVLLMGVDQISQLATCLAVFEAFRSRSDIADLKALTLQSVMTGASARELAKSAGIDDDLSLVSGMMHNLGRLIVAFTMPETYGQIQDSTLEKKGNMDDGCRAVLEFTFSEIGVAIAKHWKFPTRICAAMAGISPREEPAKNSRGQRMRAVISCAGELAEASALADPLLREARLKELRARYGAFFPISEKGLETALENADKLMGELSRTLGLRQKDASSKAARRASSQQMAKQASGDPHLLAGAMERISFGLSGPFVLNEMFTKILDAMRVGVGFEHALLMLLTPKKDLLVGRLGVGPKSTELLAAFQVPVRAQVAHPLARVVTDRHEILLTGPALLAALPEQIVALSRPSAALLVPIVIDGVSIGALYGQRIMSQGVLTETDRGSVRTLRDHAVTAIKNAR